MAASGTGFRPYRPAFYRHLNHLVANGYYARELDADDYQFLEYVRVRGIANGSLPNTDTVLLEELGFWDMPYHAQPGITRRIGRPPPVETPEEWLQARRVRAEAWRARRAIRENERAIAAAELAREQGEWEAARKRRQMREQISDAEWDAAAPSSAAFGKTIARHHVPQWKLEEARDRHYGPHKIRRDELAEVRKDFNARKAAAEAAAEAERQGREQAIQEAHRRLDVFARHTSRHSRPEVEAVHRFCGEGLMAAVTAFVMSRRNQPFTVEEVVRATGAPYTDLVEDCLLRLLREGKMKRVF